jgi:hypothetical protein
MTMSVAQFKTMIDFIMENPSCKASSFKNDLRELNNDQLEEIVDYLHNIWNSTKEDTTAIEKYKKALDLYTASVGVCYEKCK